MTGYKNCSMRCGQGTSPPEKSPGPLWGPEPFLCRSRPAAEDHLQFLLSVALVVRLVLRCWVPLVVFFWVVLVVLVLRLVVLFV